MASTFLAKLDGGRGFVTPAFSGVFLELMLDVKRIRDIHLPKSYTLKRELKSLMMHHDYLSNLRTQAQRNIAFSVIEMA